MIKHNQVGAVSGLLISFVMTVVLLCGALGFGIWAYTQRQDFKDNVDQKVAVAVDQAKQQESDRKDVQFAEAAKNPLKTYNGPEDYGSLLVAYPKTWSGYVADSGSNGNSVDGYFAPGTVPSTNDQNSVFALRIQVVSQQYSQVLQSLSSQQQQSKATINTYALPKVPKVVGVLISGQLNNSDNGKNITMVVLPLRSQTLKIWTEGNQYVDDFNNNILPNLSFSP